MSLVFFSKISSKFVTSFNGADGYNVVKEIFVAIKYYIVLYLSKLSKQKAIHSKIKPNYIWFSRWSCFRILKCSPATIFCTSFDALPGFLTTFAASFLPALAERLPMFLKILPIPSAANAISLTVVDFFLLHWTFLPFNNAWPVFSYITLNTYRTTFLSIINPLKNFLKLSTKQKRKKKRKMKWLKKENRKTEWKEWKLIIKDYITTLTRIFFSNFFSSIKITVL